MATRVKCLRDKRVRDMVVAGERCCAESVVWGMIQSSDSLLGFDLCDFQFEEIEEIYMDPGGMIICDDETCEIESMGVKIRFLRQHAGYVAGTFDPANELQVRLPNWYRIGVWGSNIYIPMMVREGLYHQAVNTVENNRKVIEGEMDQLEEKIAELLGVGTESAKMAADLLRAKLDRRRKEIE